MAKDPRFNFYPDNWEGGTEGFTLEQEGAYLKLIIMQSRRGRFTAEQAMDKLMQCTRGNTAVSTELWNFLIPKFETDGKYYWSDRLEREIAKSREHSKKQSERVKKRWQKESNDSGIQSGNTAVLPVIELELELEEDKKESLIKTIGTGKNFILISPPHPQAERVRIRGDDGLRQYFELNGSILREPEQARKFLYANTGKPYNDFRHLFNDYKQFCQKQIA